MTQRMGFEEGARIPPSLYEAFKAGDLALLPRGGVAALLEVNQINCSTLMKKNTHIRLYKYIIFFRPVICHTSIFIPLC